VTESAISTGVNYGIGRFMKPFPEGVECPMQPTVQSGLEAKRFRADSLASLMCGIKVIH
jgi:hypothetical protein